MKLLSDEVERYKSLSVLLKFKAGNVIFEEGDDVDCLYLIESGHVKNYHSTIDGKVSIISLRGPGDVFGIAGLLLNGKRCASTETLDNCKLWRMEAEVFKQMLFEYSRLAVQIAVIQGTYLREAEAVIGNLLSKNSDQKLAWLLYNLSSPVITSKGQKLRINIRLTHQDLASMIGSCRQTTTMALRRLQTAGIIKTGKYYIEIVDEKKINEYIGS